jgi:hypothetical protein
MAYQIMMNNIAVAFNFIHQKQRTRKINNETIMQFHCLLKTETWECVSKESDTNSKFNTFLSNFYIYLNPVSQLNIKISANERISGLHSE